MQHQVANWHIDRERLDEWESIWDQLHDVARQTPGFRTARLLRSVEHPGKYTIYSLWDSRASWVEYYNTSKVQELIHSSFRLLKGPPVTEWFDLVREVQGTG